MMLEEMAILARKLRNECDGLVSRLQAHRWTNDAEVTRLEKDLVVYYVDARAYLSDIIEYSEAVGSLLGEREPNGPDNALDSFD
jgi:hypothetical protein